MNITVITKGPGFIFSVASFMNVSFLQICKCEEDFHTKLKKIVQQTGDENPGKFQTETIFCPFVQRAKIIQIQNFRPSIKSNWMIECTKRYFFLIIIDWQNISETLPSTTFILVTLFFSFLICISFIWIFHANK